MKNNIPSLGVRCICPKSLLREDHPWCESSLWLRQIASCLRGWNNNVHSGVENCWLTESIRGWTLGEIVRYRRLRKAIVLCHVLHRCYENILEHCFIISQNWDSRGSLNPLLWKAMTSLSYTFNSIAVNLSPPVPQWIRSAFVQIMNII